MTSPNIENPTSASGFQTFGGDRAHEGAFVATRDAEPSPGSGAGATGKRRKSVRPRGLWARLDGSRFEVVGRAQETLRAQNAPLPEP